MQLPELNVHLDRLATVGEQLLAQGLHDALMFGGYLAGDLMKTYQSGIIVSVATEDSVAAFGQLNVGMAGVFAVVAVSAYVFGVPQHVKYASMQAAQMITPSADWTPRATK